MQRTTTDHIPEEENVGKSYTVLDDRTFYQVPGPKVVTGTLLEGASGVKSTVNDLLKVYQSFLTACGKQLAEVSTFTPGSPFKQCATLIRAHNFLNDDVSLRKNSYALGWARCETPGVLGILGINGRLKMDLPTVGTGAPSRLCLYHEGLMPGSSTNVYTFPETEKIIVVLSSAVALNDCPDWISQLLVETIFDFPEKNDYLKLAEASADKMLALVPSIRQELDSHRMAGTYLCMPLEAYTGTYWNPARNFHIVVTKNQDVLEIAFQGLRSQVHTLRHYHYETLTWQMTHNEAGKRGRLMVNYPAKFYLIKFYVAANGSVDRLGWIIENTSPEPETFLKDKI